MDRKKKGWERTGTHKVATLHERLQGSPGDRPTQRAEDEPPPASSPTRKKPWKHTGTHKVATLMDRQGKRRVQAVIDMDVVERVKNYLAYAETGETLTSFIEEALERLIEDLEEQFGEEFPERE